MDKPALRRLMRQRRAGLDPALGERLCAHLLASALLPTGAIVAGYWPLAGEIDVRPALCAAAARGMATALPITPPRGHPLTFRRWIPGDALRPGRFGTMEPDGAPVTPDVVLVPLLAFDRSGGRLGFGGGFYDRTLAALPAATAVGCAFAAQEVDTVPRETHDRPMHAIATEAGVFLME